MMPFFQEDSYYVFDAQVLKDRVAFIRSHMPKGVDLCYAIKANPFVTGEVIDHVERLEVCSPGEGYICQELKIPTEKTVISGIYKTPSFIEELVAQEGSAYIYTVESLHQMELLDRLSQTYQKVLPVLLRLTNNSQFGINAEDIRSIVADRNKMPFIDLRGIQFFSGTQKTSIKKLAREIKKMDDFLQALEADLGYRAREFEYGTGFPVAYFQDETLDEADLFASFGQLLEGMTFKAHVTLEIGRSMVATCGQYVTTVVDKKVNKGQHYAVVDGGLHHINYFGQYMGMKQPYVSVLGKKGQEASVDWSITGSLCTMNDILVKQIHLPELEIGDKLVFDQAGAYSMTEGMSLFLSRDLPAVYIKSLDGSTYRVRDTYDTYLLNRPIYK